MLIQVCLLFLCAGIYASYADSPDATTQDPLFDELGIFPEDFVSKFPKEGEFFRMKILVYLFFNLFSKYFAENQPIKFWSKFNHNDFNRVAIDATFYEYLTKFADKEDKRLVFNPLQRSKRSTEDIATESIGDYLDNLSTTELPVDRPGTPSESRIIAEFKSRPCPVVPFRRLFTGIPGRDFPNHCDIPKTSFTCADKLVIGAYADVETGCQAFHVCWPDRIESFLCPIGTIFDQRRLTCDTWYESYCPDAPSFFKRPLFPKMRTPRNAEPLIPKNYEIPTTPETPSTFAPEMDAPVYDGTCQSLLTKPLQLQMKFLPGKCQVRVLKPTNSEATIKSKTYTGKHFNRRLFDAVFRTISDTITTLLKVAERGISEIMRAQVDGKRPMLKLKKPNYYKHEMVPGTYPTNAETTTDFASTPGKMDTTSADHSTTELPFENSPLPTSGYVEQTPVKPSLEEKVKPEESELLKRKSKQSEDSKKHVLEMMLKAMEWSGSVLSDDVLPFVEEVVRNSPKKSESKQL